jgi:hypothetical protein
MKTAIAKKATPAVVPIPIAAAMPGFRAFGLRPDVSWSLFVAAAEGVLEVIVERLLEVNAGDAPGVVTAEGLEDIAGVGLAPVTADGELGGGDVFALEGEAALSQFDPFAIPNCVEYWYCPVTSSMSCNP